MKRTLSFLMGAVIAIGAGAALAAPFARVERHTIAHDASSITPQQRAMLDEKLRLIAQILSAAGADQPGTNVLPEAQRWMLESLFELSLAEVRSLGTPGGLRSATETIRKATMRSKQAKRDGAKLGQLDTELVFIPISPCRYIDTRVVDGQIPNGGSRSYDLDEKGDAYGGSSGCDPKTFVEGFANRMGAIFMNVTAVGSPFAPGFLGVRPTGSTNNTSLVNWYQSVPNVQAANAAIVPINQSLVTDEIEFFGTQTHIVVDIMGLFAAPLPTTFQCVTGTLAAQVVAAGGSFNVQAGTCPAGYRMMSNVCSSTGNDASLNLSKHGVIDATTSVCAGVNASGGSLTVTNTPWCCRLPGR